MTNLDSDELLTADEVVDRYRGKVSIRTLANWRCSGGGPEFIKLGGKVFYPKSKLVEWETKSTVSSTSQYRK